MWAGGGEEGLGGILRTQSKGGDVQVMRIQLVAT